VTTTRAAVISDAGGPIVLEDIHLDRPRSGEVRVRILATGVCRSDLSIHAGVIPHAMPVVVGHEAVGEVLELGADVDLVKEGDRVIISWIPQCGACTRCLSGHPQLCELSFMPLRGKQLDGSVRRRRADGSPLFAMGAVGAFAEEAVVPQQSLVPITTELPATTVALIGCAVLTGVGAALNTATIRPGDSVVVIGAGGVGLNIVQGARIADAGTIVAVDADAGRLEVANRLGATHLAPPDAARATVKEVTGAGADHVFEAVGKPVTARLAFDLGRTGGTTVVVGMAALADVFEVPMFQLVSQERRILGSWYGSSDIRRDVPRMIGFAEDGVLELDGLVTSTCGLEGLSEALGTLESAKALRTVVIPGD